MSYLFGWLGGLIIYLTQRDRELRFHGAQSILLSIAVLALYLGLSIVSGILGIIPVLDVIGGILFFVVFALLWIPVLGLFIFMCVKGYNLEHYKLPYIGDMAERWAVK
ncbi:MAG TPA: DUF4870 domain-containing protein [Egibacteraceae bacterium]|nr:DUF4870 domain-containing protein [Egibacteraceae bacterium]